MSEHLTDDHALADENTLADSIAGCLSNVSDLPSWMQLPALGRDTRPLLLLVARAVMDSDWLIEVEQRAYLAGKANGERAERERIAQALADHGAERRRNGYEGAALVYGAAARIARGDA